MKRLACVMFLLGVLAACSALWAHHSPSAVFDMEKKLTWTGTLTKINWVNPHITMDMDANGEAWHFESNPPAWFRRVSVTRADFADSLGKTVTVEGVRARDGSRYGYLSKFKFADGRALEVAPEARQ